jgi:hypothetical protein
MRSSRQIAVVALATAFGVMVAAPASVGAQKGKPPSVVPLRVVVQPIDSAGTFMPTTGDSVTVPDSEPGLPNEYVHQVDDVYAVITEMGGVLIDFQPTPAAPRRVNFSYANPVGQAIAPPAGQYSYSGLRMHMNSTNVSLLAMAIPSVQCIALGTAFGYSDGSFYRNSYQAKDLVSVNTTDTAFGQVTRLDANTWLLESRDGLCNSSYSHVAKLIKDVKVKNKVTYVDQGAFAIGFSMRLTRK